jgi:Holliday junction resolvasome RuvABC DNA-binding subunit
MSEAIYVHDSGKKRKATAEEIAQIEKDQAEALEAQKLFEAEQTAKAEARESAMAKLAALGLSDEEIQAIIGA